MYEAYLFTGEPRIGKTTALKYVIEHIGTKNCGGFYTSELLSKGTNERYGFRLVTLDGQGGMLARVELASNQSVSRYGVTLQALERSGIPAIYNALAFKNFVVIDEIGPMQLCSEQFKQSVLDVLSSGIPLIGTIAQSGRDRWIDKLYERADIQFYTLTEDNRHDLPEVMVDTLRACYASLGEARNGNHR